MMGNTRNEGRLFVAIYENDLGHPLTAADLVQPGLEVYGANAAADRRGIQPDRIPGRVRSGIRRDDRRDDCVQQRPRARRPPLGGAPAVYSWEFTDPMHSTSRSSASTTRSRTDTTRISRSYGNGIPGHAAAHIPPFTSADRMIAIQMGSYWGNFARTGNPNGAGLPTWPSGRPAPAHPQKNSPPAARTRCRKMPTTTSTSAALGSRCCRAGSLRARAPVSGAPAATGQAVCRSPSDGCMDRRSARAASGAPRSLVGRSSRRHQPLAPPPHPGHRRSAAFSPWSLQRLVRSSRVPATRPSPAERGVADLQLRDHGGMLRACPPPGTPRPPRTRACRTPPSSPRGRA